MLMRVSRSRCARVIGFKGPVGDGDDRLRAAETEEDSAEIKTGRLAPGNIAGTRRHARGTLAPWDTAWRRDKGD